jgi:hypothetical protein
MADEILEGSINQAEEHIEENEVSDVTGAETLVEEGAETLEETVPAESTE